MVQDGYSVGDISTKYAVSNCFIYRICRAKGVSPKQYPRNDIFYRILADLINNQDLGIQEIAHKYNVTYSYVHGIADKAKSAGIILKHKKRKKL